MKTVATQKPIWQFRLYIAAETPRSIRALENLTAFCKKEIPGHYKIEVIGVTAHPKVARTENIVALPTLVRMKPAPLRRIIGDLSDTPRLITGMEVRLTA